MKKLNQTLSTLALLTFLVVGVTVAAENEVHQSGKFAGPKANTGTVSHSIEKGKSILRVSKDFQVPDTPAPTWRVVDSKGTIHTLEAFKIKGGEKREVIVPGFVSNISRVQVYCAWAEVLLGEASFPSPVK